MSLFSKSHHDKSHHAAIPEEERIARYDYLVDTLPPGVIESAHASAFEDLSDEQRRDLAGRLRPAADGEREVADDPASLAATVRDAHGRSAETDAAASVSHGVDARAALRDLGVLPLVATGFLAAHSVSAYFTTGAGSLTIADEPEWVAATYDPGAGGQGNAILDGENAYGAGVNGFGGGGFSGASDGGGGFI